MIDAHRIVWQGLDSLEFDITTHCSFEGDSGTTSSFLNRDNIYTEHYDGRRTIHRSKYNETFTPRFTLIKQNFGDFSEEENRRILSWLTSSDKPGWLEVYRDDSNVLTWRCFGNIISLEQYKLSTGRVVGYEFEIETTHPYAWSRKFETTKEITAPTSFALECNSDEYKKLLYPTVTVTFKETITNVNNILFPVNEDYNDGTTNPFLDENYKMMPHVIYWYRGKDYKDYYYINITKSDVVEPGKYSIEKITDSKTADESGVGKYYYFYTGSRDIKTVVAVKNNDGSVDYGWATVCKVAAGVQIENTYTSEGETVTSKTTVCGGAPGETIILDGTNKIIASENRTVFDLVTGKYVPDNSTKIISDDFNFTWVPLAIGKNNITVTGNCEIKIEWIEPRKVGSL